MTPISALKQLFSVRWRLVITRLTLVAALGAALAPAPAVAQTHTTGNRPVRFRGNAAVQPLPEVEHVAPGAALVEEDVDELVALALALNPRLRQTRAEALAAWARVRQVNALPDPTLESDIFARPMMMGRDQQVAMLSVMQMLPWLSRLSAKGQEAAFEALARQQMVRATALELTAEIKSLYYQLSLLDQQLRTNEASEQLLSTLTRIATARVETGEVSQGDVLLATLEVSRLAEQRLLLVQQRLTAEANLNRLVARPVGTPIVVPARLEVAAQLPPREWLIGAALANQPEIEAARLETQATRWGIEVARLERRPDISLGLSWYFMEEVEPAPAGMQMGGDPWSVGVATTLPIWQGKYAAMRREAAQRHAAAHASVDDAMWRIEALVASQVAAVEAAARTRDLYSTTILPQARQTLAADQESYAQGRVEFDRVVADVRNLLMLEIGLHQATADLATARARLEQTVGLDLRLIDGAGSERFDRREAARPPAHVPTADVPPAARSARVPDGGGRFR